MSGPSIALRITWTVSLRPADAKVLQALASCGDWETGRRCYPKLATLASRAQLSIATVTRCLRRLEHDGWIVAATRRHRHSTTYDMCVDRLALSPPKEQQVTLTAAVLEPPTVDHKSDAQFEQQPRSVAQNEQQAARSVAQNEQPTYLPDLDQERTHTPRARETYTSEPELALVGSVPPKRCDHPHAHAWCEGRIHVPRALHFELLDRLGFLPGETRAEKAGRLIAFYAADQAQLPRDANVGNAFTYWNEAFNKWVADPRRWTRRRDQPRRAEQAPLYEDWTCPHTDDPHLARGECYQRIALDAARAARERKSG